MLYNVFHWSNWIEFSVFIWQEYIKHYVSDKFSSEKISIFFFHYFLSWSTFDCSTFTSRKLSNFIWFLWLSHQLLMVWLFILILQFDHFIFFFLFVFHFIIILTQNIFWVSSSLSSFLLCAMERFFPRNWQPCHVFFFSVVSLCVRIFFVFLYWFDDCVGSNGRYMTADLTDIPKGN